MKWYANQLGYGEEADFWGTVGLLHDLDFEQFPEQHCVKEQQILKERGADEKLIHAVMSPSCSLKTAATRGHIIPRPTLCAAYARSTAPMASFRLRTFSATSPLMILITDIVSTALARF